MMKLTIDTESRVLRIEGEARECDLYSPEAFRVLSDLWLKVGWALKYSYSFSWFGRPVIQLPEDLVRMQELIYTLKPDVLIETGVAHGGSLVFYASLFESLGKGHVVGVDVEIRPHNRAALESHPLRKRISLIEGDSTNAETLRRVGAHVREDHTVMVVLDSNHTRAHVARELEAFAPLVSARSYIVVTDGVMQDLAEVPGGEPSWREDNPQRAARDFLARHPEFVLEEPKPVFDESRHQVRLTYWPSAYLRRVN
jgi:cephalosporin hydroxylase